MLWKMTQNVSVKVIERSPTICQMIKRHDTFAWLTLGSESETGLFSFPEVACAECLVLVECVDVDVVDEFRERVRVEEVDELERRGFNESGRVNQTSRGERGGDGRGDSDK
jgi:hypothetical protein